MASKQLTSFLTTPHRIASSLDWKKLTGSVLSMDISNKRIGLYLSFHPALGESPIQLEDIPLQLSTNNGKRTLSPHIIQSLQQVAQEHKVCGVVVAWPLQRDGRMGAPCGKVLHALDSLVEHSAFLTPNRPFCLWDGSHVQAELPDSWGRCSAYGKDYTLNQEQHVASQEHYVPATNMVASDIWNDFCRTHWPELYQREQERKRKTSESLYSDYDDEYFEEYMEDDARLVALV
jgi:RNase H-fold protein (predicted Holliday junction resolvase)